MRQSKTYLVFHCAEDLHLFFFENKYFNSFSLFLYLLIDTFKNTLACSQTRFHVCSTEELFFWQHKKRNIFLWWRQYRTCNSKYCTTLKLTYSLLSALLSTIAYLIMFPLWFSSLSCCNDSVSGILIHKYVYRKN